MSRETGLLIVLGIAFVLLVLMGLGWWRRTKRDAHLHAPTGTFETGASTTLASGLYVATTVQDEPLNRLAVRGLAYRSRVQVAADAPGVMLAAPGADTVLIPAAALRAVDRASFAIDRVVERDGLVRITWDLAPETTVDTYLRLQETDPETLIAAIRALIVKTAVTGSDA